MSKSANGQVNPLDYDFIHLGVSGGKDSTAALLWLVYESGWPVGKFVVSMCDTGNEDALTYNYLAMLAERVHPIHYVFPELDFWELARKKRRFPSRMARFCTQYLKIIPLMRFVLDLKKRGRVLILSGVRRDEGRAHNDRGDLDQFSFDDTYGCDKFLPVYEWSIEDVWGCHRRHLSLNDVLFLVESDPNLAPEHRAEILDQVRVQRIPRNPLYDMGARRVGCFPCINSDKRVIRAIAKCRPERIDFIDEQENSCGNSGDRFHSFFAVKTTPLWCRSREIVTAKGKRMKVATIRDVVRWSRTSRGAKQFEMEFVSRPLACNMRGMCE